MNDLKIFDNAEFGQIRTAIINDNPYFMGSDIARALGYGKPNDAISKHCRATTKWSIPISGKKQEVNFIPEGDIYRLVIKASDQSKNQSVKEKAQRFETWVFDEVIPSIRKHGVYAVDELLNDPDLAIKAFTALKEEKERSKQLSDEINVKNQLIGELKPKADYMDKILKNPGLVTITQIAKDYGMSGQEMNGILHNLKVQYKQSGQWLLYNDYSKCGYTHSETINIEHTDGSTSVKMNTKWTQKGRLFLYQLLKDHGIYPTIDKGGK